ncbi:MAG: gliding motility-associated C-terminal domain-containing protein [Bacteroidales bacterium]|nr:gliding motility-associated C-terminal domain-containing protein [Bacteroidales bacterium]
MTKRIFSTCLFLLCLLGCYALDPPVLQCVELQNNNTRVKMSWDNSNDCASFAYYNFYVNGTMVGSATPGNGYTMCNYGSTVLNDITPASSYTCYIEAVTASGATYNSNVVQTISLTVTPNADSSLVTLEWEAPSTQMTGSTWGNTYFLYKIRDFEEGFTNTPFATIPATAERIYVDTVDVCYNYMYYQVGITNNYSPTHSCVFRTPIASVFVVDRYAPSTPVLDSVSYTGNNQVMLGFHSEEPYMYGYIVYYLNNGWEPLDTVFNSTTWIDPFGGDRCYRIAVLDSCSNSSPMTAETAQQCDMQLYQNGIDACNHSASLSWNAYANMTGGLNHYEVFLSSNQGATWESVQSTTSTSTTLQNLQLNTNYIAFVRAFSNDPLITASSNRINFSLDADESSDMTYIRSVSVIDNEYVQVKVHTSGDTLSFESITLQRSNDGVNFQDLETQGYNNGASYIFQDQSADFHHSTYYYRTYVISNCGIPTGYSNVAHNILLTGDATNAHEDVLQWSNYGEWNGEVDYYDLYRKTESELTFALVPEHISPATINTYYDDVNNLYESGSIFKYYVVAHETTNDFGFQDECISNQLELRQLPSIYIPNAFTPLQTINKVFQPISSFVSSEGYSLNIWNRMGTLIFSTHNPYQGWDGYYDGKVAPMDVYVYKIYYTLPDGTVEQRKGSVMLIY